MKVWILLLLPSVVLGALCGFFIKHKVGLYIAGAGPFLGLFVALMYTVYFAPDADGGDGFWIIALLFGGGIGAFVSIFVYQQIKLFLKTDTKESF